MANIRVDLNYEIKDGSEILFRSPVDCSKITGLAVYCTAANGTISAYEFALTDAHGQDVGNIDHLFAEDVIVKVILDVTAGKAYVQNADTNDYIENTFVKKTELDIPQADLMQEDPTQPDYVKGKEEFLAQAEADALNGKVTGIGITTIMRLTQSEYDALPKKDESTLYIIADTAQVEPDTGMAPYLHVTAPCYINTGIVPNDKTAVEITMFDASAANMEGYFGHPSCRLQSQGSPWIGSTFGTASTSVRLDNTGIKHTFRVDNTGLYIDGELKQESAFSGAISTTEPVYLFAAYRGIYNKPGSESVAPTEYLTDAKFYGAKIYQNGTLVADLVPAKDSSGVACVYDKVRDSYLYNDGTGTLIYGEEVDE